jgi:Tfp pilus assembly protein PilV
MRSRTAHSLVEVLVALTIVALGALGAAASITHAMRWARSARVHIERVDDLRVAIAALRATDCAADSVALPVLLHPVVVDASPVGALRIATVAAGGAAVTHTRYCP